MAIIIYPPTPIDDLNRVDFVGSPKHVNATSASPFDKAILYLWVWSGNLDKPYVDLATENYKLVKDKVSVSDNYITFELSDFIKPFIKPTLYFGSSVTTSNEGVFYQYKIETYYEGVLITEELSNTRFATLGYNWNYEGEDYFNYNNGSFGFYETNINKYYSPQIGYSKATINLSGSVSTTTMVTREAYTPPENLVRCADEQYLIIYINKTGLWDTFTPNGKISVLNKIQKDTYAKTFRNPLMVNRDLDHQFMDLNLSSRQSYIINTGNLIENMGMLVEEILYSPKIYLVQFLGDSLQPSDSITADTTMHSADTTLITADSAINSTGNYITYNQIPVNVTDTDFGRKTRLNDKNKINYNIKFDESSYKINNIR